MTTDVDWSPEGEPESGGTVLSDIGRDGPDEPAGPTATTEPVDDEAGRYRLPSLLLLVGMVTTAVAVTNSWTSSDPTLRRLLDGPTNGWIPLLSFILAVAVFARFRKGKWPAIIAIALVSFGALSRVVTSQALESFDRTWAWWVGLVGAGLLLAASGLTAAIRIGNRRRQPFRLPRGFKQIGGVVGLTAVIFGLWVLGELLAVEEEVSWPPPPDAVTAAGAQAATEDFAADNRHPMDISLSYAWSTADVIEAWPDGVEFFPRILADIEEAQSSIHIMMFGWKSGDIGLELASLLGEKLAQGVEVRILVDAVGSSPYGASQAMYQDLADDGAEIVVNDTVPFDRAAAALLSVPESDSNDDEVGRADHRKLYVIDGEVVWTGGAGIEDHFRNGEFHDVMVRVTGDVVRQTQAVFLTSFASHDAPLPGDLAEYFPEPSQVGTTPIAVVQTVPGGFSSATQQVREMIDQASERLDIMNPYLTDGDIVDRIVVAAERGVKVRLLLSEQSNNSAAQRASEHFFPRLIDAGVEVWLYPDAVVHAKVVVADDLVHFGTLNLDAWSLYRDFEVALVAENPDTADMFRERVFEPDIEISTAASKPSAVERVTNWVFHKLSWFL
ncbi:MAG: phospholipase D-like domain-containing protein [Acidimicrobiales bacterium]